MIKIDNFFLNLIKRSKKMTLMLIKRSNGWIWLKMAQFNWKRLIILKTIFSSIFDQISIKSTRFWKTRLKFDLFYSILSQPLKIQIRICLGFLIEIRDNYKIFRIFASPKLCTTYFLMLLKVYLDYAFSKTLRTATEQYFSNRTLQGQTKENI